MAIARERIDEVEQLSPPRRARLPHPVKIVAAYYAETELAGQVLAAQRIR